MSTAGQTRVIAEADIGAAAKRRISVMNASNFSPTSMPSVCLTLAGSNRDRWLAGMRRLRNKIYGAAGG